MIRVFVAVLLMLSAPAFAEEKKTREQKVREDKAKVEAEGFWLYNDLPKAVAQAKETGKPILVVLRCLPCEECVKLDDDLVNQDPVIKPLLSKFVCVRVVGTNGLDLETFQYDTDQSFAVFLLNADGTIYGRFGTRSHQTEWVGDVSVEAMGKALQAALELHKDYPNNKAALAAKRGGKPLFPSPEKFPSLKDKYSSRIEYEGKVVQSCIHCHQIGDAVRGYYRSQGEAIPEDVLFPAPHPTVIGLKLNPKERATVLSVAGGSAAESAGFRAGDQIRSLAGQPLISVADVQWALHTTSPDGGKVAAEVLRDGKPVSLTLDLPRGWKRAGDISWRVSSWEFRRIATGGILFKELTDEERQEAGIAGGQMALRAQHVGEYGEHAAAKNAGFQKGDIIVSYDGRTDLLRDTDVLVYGVTTKKPGDTVTIVALRDGKKFEADIPIQK